MRLSWIISLLTIPVLAADTTQVLTWTECLREAAQRNPALQAAHEGLIQSRAQARSAAGALQPTLSGGAGASYGESSAGGRTQGSDSWSADLSSSYTLFDGGATRARVGAAALRVRQSAITLSEEAARIGASLATAFTRLSFAQEQVVLLENIAERRKVNMDLVQLRYEGGKENLGSVLRSRAVYQQALQDATSSLRAVAVAQRGLAVALGRPQSDELYADGAAPQAKVIDAPPFEELVRATPAVRKAETTRALARSDVVLARSVFRPEWSTSLSAGRDGDDPTMDASSSWRAGLRVSYPFYRGRRDIYDLAAAEAAERESVLRLEQEKQSTYLSLQQAWTDARNADEQQAVQRAFLAAAEVRAEIARSQYASGLIGFQDWDQIEDEIINARKAVLASVRDATLTAAEWHRAQGRSDLEVP